MVDLIEPRCSLVEQAKWLKQRVEEEVASVGRPSGPRDGGGG